VIKVAENVWIIEGECVNFYGFAYPTRMVVIRLRSGDLWLWSPIRYTAAIADVLSPLGTVAHIVSPNKIHHLFISQWHNVFSNAKIWGPKSTIEKRNDLRFQPPLSDLAPIEWRDEIEHVWFNGSISMDEVVFFHRQSRTVIVADLSENFSEAFLMAHWKPWQRSLARLWGIVEGKGFAPLEWRLSFFKKRITRAAKNRVLEWNPEKVIMAHGQWQQHNGREFLERSFSWIR